MSMPNPYLQHAARQAKQYKQQQIETATPEQILLMLYDGAIRFLVKAKNAMEKKDFEGANNNLVKAQNILVEFMSSLDFEVGGEMAQNLYNLYEYFHYRLVQANMKQDTAMIDEVLNHLRELRKSWEVAIAQAAKENALPNQIKSVPPTPDRPKTLSQTVTEANDSEETPEPIGNPAVIASRSYSA